MQIVENVSLRDYSAMRLGGKTRFYCKVHSEDDLKRAVDFAKQKNLPVIVVGQGSNIVWRDEGFDGLLIANRITGRKILAENEKSASVWVGAGEDWDEVVEWTVKKSLSGIEFLSAIPGLAGAAPVQNIGAYGAEIAQTLVELSAFDTRSGDFLTIKKQACGFAYRTSRFKTADKGRYIIASITLKLSKSPPTPPFYESLAKYFTRQNFKETSGGQASHAREYTPKMIREAVIAIRAVKLPSPARVANNGSFFINPIISKSQFEKLQKKYPDIKGWPQHQNLDASNRGIPSLQASGLGAGQAHELKMVKISAGWLMEEAGLKGVHDKETGMATWPAQALVLVNEHAKNTADLLVFKQKVQTKIYEMFGIVLEQEPELLP